MKLALMTGLLTSALTLGLTADTRADVRVGLGVQIGVGYHDGDAWQAGYARGGDEGYRAGEHDARHHERYSYWDEHSYRDSDRGYKGWMGPRSVYERAYRQAYQEAYTRAYRRFAPWDGRNDHDYRYDHDGGYGH